MKILALSSSLGSGGAERVMAGLCNTWITEGHSVDLVTLHPRSRDFYPLAEGVGRRALGLAGPSPSRLHGAWRGFGRIMALRREIARVRPDVILSFVDRMNVVAMLASIGSGIPVVIAERTDPTTRSIRRGWGPMRRLLYPRADVLVVQTEGAARWARGYNRRIEVIPNPLILDVRGGLTPPPPTWKRPTAIAVGRLGPEKGYDLLIRAFAAVSVDHPEWHLAFLGDGPERGALEALAREQGIEARVHFLGRVPDPAPYLRASDLFVLSSRYEGFPNALLEGLSAGLPAVATDCQSGPSELVVDGENGYLVPVDDAPAYEAALRRLIEDPDARRRMGIAARKVADRYPLGVIAKRWIALFQSVVRPRKAS
jgi:glycosyltransferase involved in cell wall biosynthesis